ncbi:MAG: AraC family transcriptional regulator [Oscillospiraceae bacterium]
MSKFIEIARFSKSSNATSKHNHLSCELVFVTKGEAEFSFSDRSVKASEGTLILITALEEHSVTITKKPYERYYIILSPNNLMKLHTDPKLTAIFSKRTNSGVFTFDLSETKEKIEELFFLISKENEENNPYSEELQENIFEQLLIRLYRSNKNNFEQIKEIDRKMFIIQRCIEENFKEQITVDGLSQKFFMSKSYLTHAFKDSCGYSPQQYLILIRLINAKYLLSSTDKAIHEISSEIGFSDVNNFIRIFKKAFGVTPKAFRKNGNI